MPTSISRGLEALVDFPKNGEVITPLALKALVSGYLPLLKAPNNIDGRRDDNGCDFFVAETEVVRDVLNQPLRFEPDFFI
jgi:hypothetical protein